MDDASIKLTFPSASSFPPVEFRVSQANGDLQIYHNGWHFLDLRAGGGHMEIHAATSLPPTGTDASCLVEVTPEGKPVIRGLNG